MSHANFVAADWLDAHLGDADLRVIDASWHLPTTARNGDAEFRAGHLAATGPHRRRDRD